MRKKRRAPLGGLFLLAFSVFLGVIFIKPFFEDAQASQASDDHVTSAVQELQTNGNFGDRLAAEALIRTQSEVSYDSAYYQIDFPLGDIPAGRGKDVDVVIRSYRALGIDLQELVHEDLSKNFLDYPQLYSKKGPDQNIDHRRVPNLQRFFSRKGQELPVTDERSHYAFGDLVVWRLVDGSAHIGIVVPGPGTRSNEKWIVHNIGNGPSWEDCLLDYSAIGHYRFAQ